MKRLGLVRTLKGAILFLAAIRRQGDGHAHRTHPKPQHPDGGPHQDLQRLKTNKAKAVRFTTLEAICKVLDCQPGDLLEYVGEQDG